MNRVEKAIKNIFKENGYEVLEITDDTILASKIDKHKYTYTIDNDTMVIKNRQGRIVFEKFIQSYQESFSFTINK